MRRRKACVALSLFWRTFFLLALLLGGGIVRLGADLPRARVRAARGAGGAADREPGEPDARGAARTPTRINRVAADQDAGRPGGVRIAAARAERPAGSRSRSTASRARSARELRDAARRRHAWSPAGERRRRACGSASRSSSDRYWLQADPTRVRPMSPAAPGSSGSAIALLATVLGSAAIARLINRPLQASCRSPPAASATASSTRASTRRTLTSEIREVNMGFNRMARELAKVEQDRAVMLAGISHDLRTPLARLRLEAEMSVHDEEAQAQHGARHRPARRHHRQVHGLRAARRRQAASRCTLRDVVDARGCARSATTSEIRITLDGARSTCACWPTRSSSAACFSNLFENARRYGRIDRHRHRRACIVTLRAHRAVGDRQRARPRPGRRRRRSCRS